MDTIEARVKELVAGLFREKQVELVDIIYRRESAGMVLRLLVDKPGGIRLDECAQINVQLCDILDSGNTMPDKYTLEVASPGLDRLLKTRRDFEREVGKKVYVHSYEPIKGKRDHEGILEDVDDEKVTVSGVNINLSKISKAKLRVEFK